MAVLARTPSGLHGYVIAQRLRGVAIFCDNPPDNTGLYRVLKAMQTEGYLRSDWDTEGSGPAKRNYALTDAGWGCLHRWKDTLESYSRNLQHTVAFVGKSLQSPPSKRKQENAKSCCCGGAEKNMK
jgi:DNA-binding PadR family transcriptional regulator